MPESAAGWYAPRGTRFVPQDKSNHDRHKAEHEAAQFLYGELTLHNKDTSAR